MVYLFLSSFFLEEPVVVVKITLKKVWGVRVIPGLWMFYSDPEEVQGAVEYVGLTAGQEAWL